MPRTDGAARIECACGETLEIPSAVRDDNTAAAETVECSCGAAYSLTVTRTSPPDE